ncbi:MAG: class I SAM-dependent methyltransferase, partial [Bacteroidota bacterium]
MAFPSWLPLGLGIRDYHESGERKFIRVYTVDGEVTPYPAELFFREYDDFSIMDEMACLYVEGRILDVGAGAGCIALFLQEHLNLEVTAIEIAGPAVEVMQDLGVKDARKGDFWELKGEKWDTILLLMNGIGFVEKLSRLPVFLEKARELLNPGGQILFDSSDMKYADLDDKKYDDYTG